MIMVFPFTKASLNSSKKNIFHTVAHIGAIFVILIGFIVSSIISFRDTRALDSVTFRIAITATAQCYNGIDDDSDGLTDIADYGCTNISDDSESDLIVSNDSGGSGRVGNPTAPSSDVPPVILNSAPEKENTLLEKIICDSYDSKPYRRCSPGKLTTFIQYRDDALCEGFITKEEIAAQHTLTDLITRKELVAVVVKMRRANLVSEKEYTRRFPDVGVPGEEPWILPIVETSLALNLISKKNKLFHPDATVKRINALSLAMKGVCMKVDTSLALTYNEQVFLTAQKNGITFRTWGKFDPDRPILYQELYAFTSRLSDWANSTGGCTPKPAYCPGEIGARRPPIFYDTPKIPKALSVASQKR